MSRTSAGCGDQSHKAQGPGRGARNIEKSRGNALFVLNVHGEQLNPHDLPHLNTDINDAVKGL